MRALSPASYRRAQNTYAKIRQKALRREPDEALALYMDRIRAMEDSSGYQGSLLAREAAEIQTEMAHRASWRRTDAGFLMIRQVPKVPPRGWPRLSLITLRALGNPGLLSARDREDRLRDCWVRRAADALVMLVVSDGVGLPDILDGEAGARWLEEYCVRDAELAADAILSVHPTADVIGGPVLRWPAWKPPPPKTTLRPG